MSVIPDDEFGARLRERLRSETLIWLTTTSADGTPQPNPVWFWWDESDETVLIYNANDAVRLGHVAVRPRVALNLQANDGGGEVMVLTGVAEQALDAPPADQHEAYLEKYDTGIVDIGTDRESFGRDYGVALRVRLAKVRGFLS